MTCIVGLVDGDTVWIGGDSAGVSGWDLTVRADPKVFRNGPMLFGFTSSFRMGQLLRYALTVPDRDPRISVDRWLATSFVDAVRDCLKLHGFAKKQHDVEEGGQFLVAYARRLFMIDSDYQVGVSRAPYCAVGCGSQVAHGALCATAGLLSAPDRVRLALEAAEQHSVGVRAPFVLIALGPDSTNDPGTP